MEKCHTLINTEVVVEVAKQTSAVVCTLAQSNVK